MSERQDAARRTVRTVLQTALALAAALPLIVSAAGLPESLPGVALALAVAAGVTRVMALEAVDRLLPGWLRRGGPDGPVSSGGQGGRGSREGAR
ncbi:hypothetical protein [Yinghuangia soli]|uniref:Holin n=1 Tax=Yinghuangia soli TaxID=2908204 RepID=A0AA41Q343_9ACTN|nr:hypothetical protein [Yinghuangia soli]MCF2530678.1 hypothetical protein [Yinghuangia soli]